MPKLSHFSFDNKIIARGFTSVVYKGIDESTNKNVAIKCIDEAILDQPTKKKMLANELNIHWELKQEPFIVEIQAQFYQNDFIYIVTEFCESGDLKNKIKQKGKFVEPKSVSYMIDIIKGFQTLLRHNIVHRDLKPSNIMISKKGIKIGDFGFAYKCIQNKKVEEINVPSAGSPLYMAPQVLEDGRNSSHLSDIWSLGVVFFEMLTGRIPFPAKNKEALIKLIDRVAIRMIIPENISPRSKQFLLRTLKKDPAKRMTPQELIQFEFDEQILFQIQQNRKKKLEQQHKRNEEGYFSSQSQQRVGSSEKVEQIHKNDVFSPPYIHLKDPEDDKNVHQHQHHHHQNIKEHELQKTSSNNHTNVVNEQLIKKIMQKHPQLTRDIDSFHQFDNNVHKGKNLLDPHDIKVDRQNKNMQEKNKIIGQTQNKTQEESQKHYPLILICKQKLQNGLRNNNQTNKVIEQLNHCIKNHSKSANHHQKNNRQIDTNSQTSQIKQRNHYQTKIQINSESKISIEQNLARNREMKKEEIIEVLLNRIDTVRFMSRIMHTIQELHHLHINERSSGEHSLSHHYTHKDAPDHSKNIHGDQTIKQPTIYILLKQLIYKTILQIEKLDFLSCEQASNFYKSEEFQQIKLILDTYRNKLDLVEMKKLQWKGVRVFEKEVERQILLIYSTIKHKISLYEGKNLDAESREIRKLNRKIQALDCLIVFRYDYLILQRQHVLIGETGSNIVRYHQNSSRIKQIIEEKHSKLHNSIQSLEEYYVKLKSIEEVMRKIKII